MQRLWSTTCRRESIFSKERNRVLIKLNSQSRNEHDKSMKVASSNACIVQMAMATNWKKGLCRVGNKETDRYIRDKYGRKKALELRLLVVCIVSSCARHVSLNSRNLMHAFVAFFQWPFLHLPLGCLPSYDQVGWVAIALLLFVPCLQGLSVGGQLMSSLVFTMESHPKAKWGLYGSTFVYNVQQWLFHVVR
jgi:hypothetical protein